MAKERICLCCGKPYSYCPNCGGKSDPGMTTEFDSESCKEVFNAVSAYNMEIMDANGVKSVLKKYNITDFSKYKKSIVDVLKKVDGVKTETPKEEKPESAPVPERTGFMKRDTFKKKNHEDKANA